MTHGPWNGETYGGASVAAGKGGEVLAILRDRDVDVHMIDIALAPR
jgi:hypothetical protein